MEEEGGGRGEEPRLKVRDEDEDNVDDSIGLRGDVGGQDCWQSRPKQAGGGDKKRRRSLFLGYGRERGEECNAVAERSVHLVLYPNFFYCAFFSIFMRPPAPPPSYFVS